MSATLQEIVAARKARLKKWEALGVPDYGINLRPRAPVPIMVPLPERKPARHIRHRFAPDTAWNPRKKFGDCVSLVGSLVAQAYGIRWSRVLGGSQKADLVRPRRIGMTLARSITVRSGPTIAKEFGGVHPSTVFVAIRDITAQAMTDFDLGSELAALECSICRKLEQRC